MLARHRAHGFGIENNRPLTDGVVTGWGMIDGRKVFVFSQDFTVFGGALGEVYAEKIHKVMDLAESVGAPLIGLNDGGGARIQEGVVSLASYGGIFFRNVKASGVIPQISVVLGPCAGGAVYSPAMTDFIFMVKGVSNMFITGPDVVKTVTGEDVTQEELGGAMTHATKSGVATFVYHDEQTCLEQVRYLMSFLPANNLEDPPYFEPTDDPERSCDALLDLIPDSPEPPVRHEEGHRRSRRRRRLPRGVPALGHEHRVRVRAHRRLHASASSATSRRCSPVPRHRRVGEGGALRAHVRRVQRAAADVRRRPRLPPRHRPGVRRHHPPRRQAALRLLRSDGAARAGDHAQGHRRRVRRHELEVDRRRHRVRVAVGRDRGDGRVRRGQHHLPAGDRDRGRPGRAAGRARPGVHRALLEPVPGGRARLRRRRHRPARHAQDARSSAFAMLRTKREQLPPRKHGNSPL